MDILEQQLVGILGFGQTGRAAVRFLRQHGQGSLLVYDDRSPEEIERPDWAETADWYLNGNRPDQLPDAWIVSPGVPPDHPLLERSRSARVPLFSELDLGWSRARGSIIAVTGTNGKTSTVRLLGGLLTEWSDDPVEICGNCGYPFSEAVREHPEATFVVEVSSFQIEWSRRFLPQVGVLTSLGADHLDRHGSLERYHDLKRSLLRMATDRAVLAAEENLEDGPEQRRTFDQSGFEGADGWRQLEDLVEPGKLPNYLQQFPQNLTASLAACPKVAEGLSAGDFDDEWIPSYRASRRDLPGGRWVINDSKATNPGAVLNLLDSIQPPFRLVIGGGDKDLPVHSLGQVVEARGPVEVVVAGSGDFAVKFAEECSSRDLSLRRVNTWKKAVQSTLRRLEPGEGLVFSPGGTSFDRFENYAQRGQAFDRWCKEVVPGGSAIETR